MAAALGPGLLAENDVPEPVRRVLAASLKNAWYSIGGDHKHIFRTGSGTSPGSPIADVMFQVLFTEAVRRIEHLLAELAGEAQESAGVTWTPTPSWMDDLAVPLRAQDGDALMDITRMVVRAIHTGLRRIGVSLNLAHGKTELQPVFHGQGAKRARQHWLCETGAELTVALDDGQPVRVSMTTKQYVHLGALLDAGDSDVVAIQHRAKLMREMVRPLKKLLRSPCLDESEKVDILRP